MTFGGLSIEFDDRVLRPRPWTVAQSYWAADLLRTGPEGPVLELCAGVGHIGLLAVLLEPRDLVLVDLDATACRYARANARAAQCSTNVEVLHGSLEQVLPESARFAGIIADPPWVPRGETGRFPQDPLRAIDGGVGGLEIARSCIDVAGKHLVSGGWLLLQLGTASQVTALEKDLATSADVALELRETRAIEERGVLVHLAHPRGRSGCRPAR